MQPILALATLFLSIIIVGGTLVAAYDALERRLRRPIAHGSRVISGRAAAGPFRSRRAAVDARASRARPLHGVAVAQPVPGSKASSSLGRPSPSTARACRPPSDTSRTLVTS